MAGNGNYYVLINMTTREWFNKMAGLRNGCLEEIVDLYSYEEAELECLRKLIEIVKTKK